MDKGAQGPKENTSSFQQRKESKKPAVAPKPRSPGRLAWPGSQAEIAEDELEIEVGLCSFMPLAVEGIVDSVPLGSGRSLPISRQIPK